METKLMPVGSTRLSARGPLLIPPSSLSLHVSRRHRPPHAGPCVRRPTFFPDLFWTDSHADHTAIHKLRDDLVFRDSDVLNPLVAASHSVHG
jgi:hypothetical protein